ncbi:MAG: retroviral-like aspartic protease family protein [Candidatus Njordarchaeota archaeon]
MGRVIVDVEIINPKNGKSINVRLLVDTGSTLTWIRKEKLEKIGIEARRKISIKSIDGREIERSIGFAEIKYENHEAPIIVVFAEKNDAEVLGLTAIESLGYEVDPISRRLEYVGHYAF